MDSRAAPIGGHKGPVAVVVMLPAVPPRFSKPSGEERVS
jgi:hypothetical protein